MRTLNYKTEYQKLLSPEIVSYLVQIHEMKGQQNLFVEAQKDALAELLKIANVDLMTKAPFEKAMGEFRETLEQLKKEF